MKNSKLVCALLVLASTLAGCSSSDPAKSARTWLDASLRGDADKLAAQTCSAQLEVVQKQPAWLTTFAATGLTGQTAGAKADLSGLQFTTANKEDDTAVVQVSGEIRFAAETTPTQQISETLHLAREGRRWKVCQELTAARRTWERGGALLSLGYASAEAVQAAQAGVVENAKGIGLAASWVTEGDNSLFLLLPPMDQSTASELIATKAGVSGTIKAFEPAARPLTTGFAPENAPADGMMIVLQANLPDGAKPTAETMDAAVQVVRNRLDGYGLIGSWVQIVGSDRVFVMLVGSLPSEPDTLIAIISQTGLLQFVDTADVFVETGASIPDGAAIVITGKDIKSALTDIDSAGRLTPALELWPEGAKRLEEHTARNIGKYLAVAIDGQVLVCPNIQATIAGGSVAIPGNFTLQEATRLTIFMRYGPLPIPLEVVDASAVAPAIVFGLPAE